MQMLKKILIKLYNALYKLLRNVQWPIQALILKKRHVISAKPLSFCEEDRILIVAPHADDELIGCYELIRKNKYNCDVVCLGLTGYDDSVENKNVRLSEFKKFCETVGVNAICADDDFSSFLNSLLCNRYYSCVLVPSPIDWHWEHRNVTMALLRLVKDTLSCRVMLYRVSVPISCRYISDFCYATNEKWRVFDDTYYSQQYMPIKRYQLFEETFCFSGKTIEPYFEIDTESIDLIIERIEDNVDKLNDLKKHVNSLTIVEKLSDELYDIVFSK